MSTQRISMVEADEPQTAARRAGHRGGKFLTFFLSDEEYGLEILRVSEIIGMMSITPIPRTDAFVRGVINLRGKVIPVIDLRLKLGMDSRDATEETCIIVVRVKGAPMGIIVDKVSEVCDIAEGRIEDTPAFGAGINTDFILGIGKSNDGRVKLLLDIDRVLADGEAEGMQAAAAEMMEPAGA
jgi:purine-binding chemotaxis protein CheW